MEDQELVEEEVIKQEKEQDEIEEKIDQLKAILKKKQNQYQREVFEILNKIFEIRRKVFKNYRISDLARESVIKEIFNYGQVYSIMALRMATPKLMKIAEQEKITYPQIVQVLVKHKRMIYPQNQEKFIEKWNKKEITSNHIHELNSTEFMKKIGGEVLQSEENENVKVFKTKIYGELNSIRNYIATYWKSITKHEQEKIKNEIYDLLKLLD